MTTVSLAYVHSDERASCFEDSKEALVAHDRAHGRYLDHAAGRIAVRCGTDGLVAARNAVAAAFLASDVDWLLWVDTDMGFEPDALYRLLEVADPAERPIVGGLCFASRQYAHDGMHGFRTRPSPTLLQWREVDGVSSFLSMPLYPVDELVQVAATGSAFVLIHRSVFERVGPAPYDRINGSDGHRLGEDISFCVRAGVEHLPVFVHTGIRTTHLKPQWVGETDHWRAYNAPPAVERVAVLVDEPTEEFVRSLLASTGLATIYPTGTSDLTEPWLLLTLRASARFHPGWLDHALHVADHFEAAVVATTDPADPDAVRHVLARREFAGLLADRTPAGLAAAAREVGLFARSRGAIVEASEVSGG